MISFAEAVERAEAGRLGGDDAAAAMEAMADGAAAPDEMERILLSRSLDLEAVSPEVLAGFARVVRARAVPVPLPADGPPLIDTCGTGGGAGTLNVSTAAALVAAAAGLRVAKHGNRAVASRCGSADVLEALGVAIDLPPEGVARSIAETGFGFLFAQKYHRAFSHVAPVRKALAARGRRTVFNLLGPLCNPAGARRQVIGVFHRCHVERVARVLGLLGSERALVACGESSEGPVDEVSTFGATSLAEWRDGGVALSRTDPAALGLPRTEAAEAAGGDAAANAARIERILSGADSGPAADLVAANAAAALLVGDRTAGLAEGVAEARGLLRAGAAARLLDRLRALR